MQIIDEIDIDLKNLILEDFGIGTFSDLNKDVLLKWFHFKARQIAPRFRKVIVSDEVKSLSNQYPTLNQIHETLSFSGDMSPWLSDRIRKQKSDIEADLMFNDWQIHHFHLGKFYQTPNKIKRTRALLFVFISTDHAVFLDIQPHRGWSDTKMLKILLRTHPSDMEKFKLNGVVGLSKQYDSDALYKLRKSGVSSPVEINGDVYMPPGMGVTTSKHSVRIIKFCDHFYDMKKAVFYNLKNDCLPFFTRRVLASNLLLPIKLEVRLDRGQMIIFEKNRKLDLMETNPLV